MDISKLLEEYQLEGYHFKLISLFVKDKYGIWSGDLASLLLI